MTIVLKCDKICFNKHDSIYICLNALKAGLWTLIKDNLLSLTLIQLDISPIDIAL